MPINVATPENRNVTQKETEKKKIQEFNYRDAKNAEHETYDHTGNKWNHRNGTKYLFHLRRNF